MTTVELLSGKSAIIDDRAQVVTIPLTQGKTTIIDLADLEAVLPYSWCAAQVRPGHWYAVGSLRGQTVRMHRLLLGLTTGEMGDHRDGNGLNNRRSNLRTATRTQNNRNRRAMGASSAYIGVSRKKGRTKTEQPRWEARISIDGRAKYIGLFATEVDAARAYDIAAYDRDPEFARLNFPTNHGR